MYLWFPLSLFFLFIVRIVCCSLLLNWNLFGNYVGSGNTFCTCGIIERSTGDFNERKKIEFLILLRNLPNWWKTIDRNLYIIKYACTFQYFIFVYRYVNGLLQHAMRTTCSLGISGYIDAPRGRNIRVTFEETLSSKMDVGFSHSDRTTNVETRSIVKLVTKMIKTLSVYRPRW